MSAAPQSIIERIQKLQALADRPGSEAEAVNAAARVRELLDKYNLDLGEVNIRVQGAYETDALKRQQRESWLRFLMEGVTKLCGVGGYWWHEKLPGKKATNTMRFYGARGNVETAVQTLEYFMATGTALYKARRKQYIIPAQLQREAYLTGFGERVWQRIGDWVDQRNLTQDTMAIILVTDELRKRREDELKAQGMRTSGDISKMPADKRSFQEGRYDGGRVDLHGTGKQLA